MPCYHNLFLIYFSLLKIYFNRQDRTTKKSETDDDVVLVTDRCTQTDDVKHNVLSSQRPLSASSYFSNTNIGTQTPHSFSSQSASFYESLRDDTTLDPPQLQDLYEDELITDATDDSLDKKKEPEAPSLKVEYVSKVWDAYIDDFLVGCDHIDQAAIYDIATAKCIACSSEFIMSDDEYEKLEAMISSLQLQRSYRNAVTINGRHFRIVLSDGRRGLMARTDERDGCSACKTRTLVIIALHRRRANARICNEELMRLGDFFWVKGL